MLPLRRVFALLVPGLLALLAGQATAQEQDAEWWTYQTQRAGLAYTVKLDMGLRRAFPLSGFPYVLVTRVNYAPATGDGLPAVADQDRLESLSDDIAAAIARKTRSLYAGTTFSQGQQQSYFYVIDPNGLESIATSLQARLCQACKSSATIQADPAWALYREQLLPDAETRQRYGLRSY